MPSTLAEQIAEIFAKGEGFGEPPFLPLVTLDSEARYGLDAGARWILAVPEAAPLVIGKSNVHLLHEALEWKRTRFDDAVTESARALGLPEDEIVDSFPVFDLVRAIFEKKTSYLTRLALAWLRPSELREVRSEILLVSKDKFMPAPVRGLAERLVVPE
ncbi:MAG: hypothetical protein ABJE95_38685 [Byssovorax sp.]